jgi:hypothetical protein
MMLMMMMSELMITDSERGGYPRGYPLNTLFWDTSKPQKCLYALIGCPKPLQNHSKNSDSGVRPGSDPGGSPPPTPGGHPLDPLFWDPFYHPSDPLYPIMIGHPLCTPAGGTSGVTQNMSKTVIPGSDPGIWTKVDTPKTTKISDFGVPKMTPSGTP